MRIDAQRRPSTLADDFGYEGFRTSETCDLPGSWTMIVHLNEYVITRWYRDWSGTAELIAASGEP